MSWVGGMVSISPTTYVLWLWGRRGKGTTIEVAKILQVNHEFQDHLATSALSMPAFSGNPILLY